MASPHPTLTGGVERCVARDQLCGTAAGEDAEGAIAAGVAAVPPDDFGPEALAPLAASEGAGEAAERMARKRALAEGFPQMVQCFGCGGFSCYVFHIVIPVYHR